MSTLFGLRTQAMDLIAALREIEDSDEEFDRELNLLQQQLELQEEIEDKAVRVMMLIDGFASQIHTHKQDAQASLAAAKQLEKKVQYLKTALAELMQTSGQTTICHSYGTIKVTSKTEWNIAVAVPMAHIPERFLSLGINKALVKAAIDNGDDVREFFSVEQQTTPTVRVWRKRSGDESEVNP